MEVSQRSDYSLDCLTVSKEEIDLVGKRKRGKGLRWKKIEEKKKMMMMIMTLVMMS